MDITSSSNRSESTTRKTRLSKKAIFALAFYVIIPTIAVFMIMGAYPELSKDRLIGMLVRAVPIGIILIFVSQFGVRYDKGDIRRFVLNEIYVVLVLLWLFALLGGEPVIHQTWQEYHFSLNIWNYMLLIFFVTCVNALYYLMEYKAYRNKEDPTKEIDEKDKSDDETLDRSSAVIVTTDAD